MAGPHSSLILILVCLFATQIKAERWSSPTEVTLPSSRCKDVKRICLRAFVDCEKYCIFYGREYGAMAGSDTDSALIPVLRYNTGYDVWWENVNRKYPILVTIDGDPSYDSPLPFIDAGPFYHTYPATQNWGTVYVLRDLSNPLDKLPPLQRLALKYNGHLIVSIGQPEDPASASLPNRNISDTSHPFIITDFEVYPTKRHNQIQSAKAVAQSNAWWDDRVSNGLKIGLGVGIPLWTILMLFVGYFMAKWQIQRNTGYNKDTNSIELQHGGDLNVDRELASDEGRIK